jgi:UDP-N-acetylmuramate: L-alanyl-gamma-D-glutamyl-meso-diaminopimelate ligase
MNSKIIPNPYSGPLTKGSKIYFMGIGGTGMAAVAGLFQEAGYQISGSDAGIYPPMSNMLEELKIPVRTPYATDNVKAQNPDLVVVANVLSRGNIELEYALENNLKFTSFPALLGEHFLSSRISAVVAGTHGKTTTSSLLAHILYELGEDPSFVIGGIPRNFPRSFRLGKSSLVVIEGDEYDTAFFDKGPKFLHYRPKHLILNNLEFDHADIYENLAAIEKQFANVANLVTDKKRIIANVDDPGIRKLVCDLGIEAKVLRVAALGQEAEAEVRILSFEASASRPGAQHWVAKIATAEWGDVTIETTLSGRHNLANIAMVLACLMSMTRQRELKNPLTRNDLERVKAAISSFTSVKRRLDHLGSFGGIDVYEDFAHHPTAVRNVIEGFKAVYPKKRLVVAFEPRSATNRRNVFQEAYAKTLALADLVFIGESMNDQRIPEDQRFSATKLELAIGKKAQAFNTNDALLMALKDSLQVGDAVIFMSSGSFSGAQHKLATDLKTRFG